MGLRVPEISGLELPRVIRANEPFGPLTLTFRFQDEGHLGAGRGFRSFDFETSMALLPAKLLSCEGAVNRWKISAPSDDLVVARLHPSRDPMRVGDPEASRINGWDRARRFIMHFTDLAVATKGWSPSYVSGAFFVVRVWITKLNSDDEPVETLKATSNAFYLQLLPDELAALPQHVQAAPIMVNSRLPSMHQHRPRTRKSTYLGRIRLRGRGKRPRLLRCIGSSASSLQRTPRNASVCTTLNPTTSRLIFGPLGPDEDRGTSGQAHKIPEE